MATIDIAPQLDDGSQPVAAIQFSFPIAAVGVPDQIVRLRGQFLKQHCFGFFCFAGEHSAESFDYRFHADTLHAYPVAKQAIPIAAEAGQRMDHCHRPRSPRTIRRPVPAAVDRDATNAERRCKMHGSSVVPKVRAGMKQQSGENRNRLRRSGVNLDMVSAKCLREATEFRSFGFVAREQNW